MANEKIKSENYQQFGGINSHWSPYVLSPLEFLDIVNFDFQTVGSLTQRWGSTQYFGQTFPGPIKSLTEVSYLSGASYVITSHSGGIWYGATTGTNQGMSFTIQNATVGLVAAVNMFSITTPNPSGSNFGFFKPIGDYYLGLTTLPVYGYGSSAGSALGESFYIDPVGLQADNALDYAILDNFLFMADGTKFLKFNGVTTTPVGLPPVLWATNADYVRTGNGPKGFGSITGSSTGGTGFQYGPSFGSYYLWASYVNNRGFEGPIWPLTVVIGNNAFNATTAIDPGAGNTGILQATIVLATPLQYGISAINIYSFYDPYNVSIGQSYAPAGNLIGVNTTFDKNIAERFWNLGPPNLMQTISASGSTFTAFQLGVPASAQAALQANAIGAIESTVPNSYLPLGLTVLPGLQNQQTSYGALYSIETDIVNYVPRYLETYQNRLFLAGFSTTPSTVWFSDLAEPEGYTPDANFEVRTNDGDVITCMKAYSTRLYIFKERSFHVLSGDSPQTFFLQEISNQYGCLNNSCAVIFDDMLVFLDQKGVILFNGSQLSVLSPKVQSYFDRMNFNVALQTAVMAHDKLRNQVVIGIPIDGSSTNNITLVFDYLLKAWTTYEGYTPTVYATIQGRNVTKNLFYGDNVGRVNWFGPSFMLDNGTGMSLYFKSRFLHDLGESIQKQFRRLYINATPPGATLLMPVHFYQDYGTSIVASVTFPLGVFQNRIDYGISAKSLAFELYAFPTVKPLQIHGFTIESRLQRRV